MTPPDPGADGPEHPRFPEPSEPSPGARLVIVLIASVLVIGFSLYGVATTAESGSDGFFLFLGAAVVGVAVAIRQVTTLLAEWRRHRDP